MQRPTGFNIAIFAIILLVLAGIIFLSNGEDQSINTITPTAVPTLNNSVTPEPSVTAEVTPEETGDVSGDVGIQLSEVAEHATEDDCWIAIEGNVYDVTDFIFQHPGGDEILDGCGTDATELFNNRPDNRGSHSNTARVLLPQYLIGELAE